MTGLKARWNGEPRASSVRVALASWIGSGRYGPGTRLPPEPELAARLSVSRATLREALRSLEEEGVVARARGVGTMVLRRPDLGSDLARNFGAADAIRAAGMGSETRPVAVALTSPTNEEAQALALPAGEDVARAELVGAGNGRPVVYARCVLPGAIIGDRVHLLWSLRERSIYELLIDEWGVVVHHGTANIRASRAGRRVASRLEVARGAPVLDIRQVDYDGQGRPVLYRHEHHLTDAVEVTVVRRGPGASLGRSPAEPAPA